MDLFINSMRGQISDGQWKNSRNTVWLWGGADIFRLGDKTELKYGGYCWSKKTGYPLTKDLIDCISERIYTENGFTYGDVKALRAAWKEVAEAIKNWKDMSREEKDKCILTPAKRIQKIMEQKYNIKLTIKEPNDLMLNGKKICGILTESNTIGNKINYVIISIGFNVNEDKFPNELENIATSLYKENYNVSRIDIVKEILCQFEKLYLDYIEKDDKKEVLDICRQYSAIINKEIYVIKNDQKELVDCIGINEEGNLIIKNKDGKLEEIMSGEVSIRGVKGYV